MRADLAFILDLLGRARADGYADGLAEVRAREARAGFQVIAGGAA